jgi:hypothetical protein
MLFFLGFTPRGGRLIPALYDEDAATANGKHRHRWRQAGQKPLVRMVLSNTVVFDRTALPFRKSRA